jgi:hypothetical protein
MLQRGRAYAFHELTPFLTMNDNRPALPLYLLRTKRTGRNSVRPAITGSYRSKIEIGANLNDSAKTVWLVRDSAKTEAIVLNARQL